MNQTTQTISTQKYSERLNEIDSWSTEFSAEFNKNAEEVFQEAVRFNDPRYSKEQIKEQLQRKFCQETSRMNLNASNTNYRVWLIFGETGQGKSTFTNTICEAQVAMEGEGIKSKMENIGLYTSHEHRIIMIDTPNLYDTRMIENREISKQIVETVQNELEQNAHIDAIFFLWCPTASMRLRLKEILEILRKALGDEAINSVVFLVNEVSDPLKQNDAPFNEFRSLLSQNHLENHVFKYDLKHMTTKEIQELKELTKNVRPYMKEYFETYRMKKDLEIQRRDEETKKEMRAQFEKLANEMEGQYKQKAHQLEEKFTHDLEKQEDEKNEMTKILQQYQAEIETLRRQSRA